MKYVYLLQSISHPGQRYIGMTDDFDRRLIEHNAGESFHTKKYKPWKYVVVVKFENDAQAVIFEGYLKSGSGRAFANKHFWTVNVNE